MEPWEKALETFLKEWLDKDEVVGALVCGSYVTGNPTNHSDIDLHLILSSEIPWRERGNRIIDGFLIEYFANPTGQIKRYFESDYNDNRTMAATQFATGRIIFDDTGEVSVLKQEALEWKQKPFNKPDEITIGLTKYALWDNLDNLQDSFEHQAPDFTYNYHHTIQRIFEVYARFLGQPIIEFSKIYTYLRSPEIYQTKYLFNEFLDAKFAGMMIRAITETDHIKMLNSVEELTAYVIDTMGGLKVDGFKARTPAQHSE